jgi:hypothetical protein
MLIFGPFVLAGCGAADDEYIEEDAYSEESGIADYEGEEKAGETYQEYDARRDSYDGAYGSFAGDECTEDCSGHEAGYEWARDRGIDDPDDCGGNSWSFEEGCRAYAEEQGY